MLGTHNVVVSFDQTIFKANIVSTPAFIAEEGKYRFRTKLS